MRGRYFIDNQRFISAAMRSRPASPSASLRRCPSGILRASAITSVARASQSRLWANRADTGLEEEPTIICARTGESACRARSTTVAASLDGVVTSLVPIFWIRCSILLSPANQSRIGDDSLGTIPTTTHCPLSVPTKFPVRKLLTQASAGQRGLRP